MKKIALMFLLLSFQVVPDDLNTDLTETQQELYQGIIQEVRCLVCQNQSIAESNAELAKDLREEIFQQVEQGRNETEVKSYLRNAMAILFSMSPVLSKALISYGYLQS